MPLVMEREKAGQMVITQPQRVQNVKPMHASGGVQHMLTWCSVSEWWTTCVGGGVERS